MKLNISREIQKNAYKVALENNQNDLANMLALVGIDVSTFDTENTDEIELMLENQKLTGSYSNSHMYEKILYLCSIINNANKKLSELE